MGVATGTALLLGSLASAAGSAASAAMAPDAPGAPDYAAASRAGVEADVDTLAYRRQVEAAARMGGTALRRDYTKRQVSSNQAVTDAQTAFDSARSQLQGTPTTIQQPVLVNGRDLGQRVTVPNPAYTTLQEQLSRAQRDLTAAQQIPAGTTGFQYFDKDGNPVSESDAVYDFSGLGDADFQSENARRTAETMLKLQKDLGPQFIQTMRDQLKQADPEGFAAREKQFELAMQGVNQAPDTRIATTVQDQLLQELQQGAKLTPDVQNEVEQNVRRGQAARGNLMGNAPQFQESMEIGSQAENRRAGRQARGLSFLQSGVTPDDVNFRRTQQNQANLASFLSGTTPVTQFGQLSGSGAGVVPFAGGAPLQTNINPNAGQQGAQNAFGAAGLNQQAFGLNQNTPNPWTAGISTMFSGLGAAGKLGWNPFGTSQTGRGTVNTNEPGA